MVLRGWQSETEWQEVQNAALAVIGAGNLLALGGAAAGEKATAQEPDWKEFNNNMIALKNTFSIFHNIRYLDPFYF